MEKKEESNEEGCLTGILIDISDTIELSSLRKNEYSSSTGLNLHWSVGSSTADESDICEHNKENSVQCATESSGQLTRSTKKFEAHLTSCQSDSERAGLSSEQLCLHELDRCNKLIDEEDFSFEFLSSEDIAAFHSNQRCVDETTLRRLSALNAHEVAELFEQANTMAVRLKMAVTTDERNCNEGDVRADNSVAIASTDSIGAVRPLMGTVEAASVPVLMTVVLAQSDITSSNGIPVDSALCHIEKGTKIPTPKSFQSSTSLELGRGLQNGQTLPVNKCLIRKSSFLSYDGRKRNMSNASVSSCGSVSSNSSAVASQDNATGTKEMKPKLLRKTSSVLTLPKSTLSASAKRRQSVSTEASVSAKTEKSDASVRKTNQVSKPGMKQVTCPNDKVSDANASCKLKSGVGKAATSRPVCSKVSSATAGKVITQASKR